MAKINEQKILDMVFKVAGKHVEKTSDLRKDLGMDSLDMVELILQTEQGFDVRIPDDIASEVKTVQDIIDKIEELSK